MVNPRYLADDSVQWFAVDCVHCFDNILLFCCHLEDFTLTWIEGHHPLHPIQEIIDPVE